MIVGRVICQLPRIELLTQVLRRKLSVGDLYALGGRGSGNNEKKKKIAVKDPTEPERFGTSASPKVRCRYDLRRRLLSLD